MPVFITVLLKCSFFGHSLIVYIYQLVILVFVTESGVSHKIVIQTLSDNFTCV
jgi:hypothetical protein